MRIRNITANNKKKSFEIKTSKGQFEFPFSRLRLLPSKHNKIRSVYADPELDKKAFTYVLENGAEDSVLLDAVLAYNKDPDFLKQMLLYRLSIKAKELLKTKKVSKREVMRRLNTSPTQFYRLIDQTFYGKTIDQMIRLLAALDCPVDLVFKKAA